MDLVAIIIVGVGQLLLLVLAIVGVLRVVTAAALIGSTSSRRKRCYTLYSI